jgi:hypothetical protein
MLFPPQVIIPVTDVTHPSPQISALALPSSYGGLDYTSTSFNAKAYYIASRVQFGILLATLVDTQDSRLKKETAHPSPHISALALPSSYGGLNYTSISFNAKAYYIASRVQFGILLATLMDTQDPRWNK